MQSKQIQLGQEFRIKIQNDRICRVKGSFAGTPIYIRCTSGTGLMPPKIVLIPEDSIAEITFQDGYLIGESYHFIIDEQSATAPKTYEAPPVKKSIAGNQYFRAEIQKSQETLDQKFNGKALSFDQSYFTRTIGQIVVQHRLEGKFGSLVNKFDVFSGAGFGSLQAFSCALGYSADELNRWYLGSLLKVVRKGYIQTGVEIASSILLNRDNDRIKSSKAEKVIRNYFKAKGIDGNRIDRDLTVKECKKEVYIPVWDISRRTMTITRKTFPDMPIYLAACAAMLDPVFFNSKPMFEGFGVMNGDIKKNNDVYLRMHNSGLNIISIGSPVRVFDKGQGALDERSKLIKKDEQKHDGNLDVSRALNNATRYECNPVDELFQFASNDKAIQTVQKSGAIDV